MESLQELLSHKKKSRKNHTKATPKTKVISKKKSKSKWWTEHDLWILYKGLVLFGTDFSSIEPLLANKNRTQIINKFHREEKKNPKIIEEAL